MDRQSKLTNKIDFSTSQIAEIGALCNPLLTKAQANVTYVDYADAAHLRAHYAGNPWIDPQKIVETDAVWGNQTLLKALGRKVDYVLASHVVEHVPDLITWLNEIDASLMAEGQVRLAIPDRRFTFDFLRRETSLSDVLAAQVVGARVPQPIALLDYYLNATEVDCGAAWKGLVNEQSLKRPDNFSVVMSKAVDAYANGTYHDAHCWVFTPHSFACLFEQLGKLGLITFACDEFFDTEPNSIEFFVSMRRSSEIDDIASSWHRMGAAVRPDAPGSRHDLESKIQQLSDEVAAAQEALEKDRRNSEAVSLELLRAQNELGCARSEARQLRASRSWKLTAPYRALGSVWHRIRSDGLR